MKHKSDLGTVIAIFRKAKKELMREKEVYSNGRVYARGEELNSLKGA